MHTVKSNLTLKKINLHMLYACWLISIYFATQNLNVAWKNYNAWITEVSEQEYTDQWHLHSLIAAVGKSAALKWKH